MKRFLSVILSEAKNLTIEFTNSAVLQRPFAVLRVTTIVLAGILFFVGCSKPHEHNTMTAPAKAAKYHCPMHPTVVSDKKGS